MIQVEEFYTRAWSGRLAIETSDLSAVFNLLKAHLKAKKISYAQLARRLKMSESNIKRIFSAQSCSVDQLSRMCEACGCSIFDIFAGAAKKEAPSFQLSKEAEAYFLKNFKCFVFYRHLAGATDTGQFIEGSKLPPLELKENLKALTKLGLIEDDDGEIRICGTGYLDMSEAPRLLQLVEEKWVPWFIDRTLRLKKSGGYFLRLSSTGLSKANRARFESDLSDLLEKYKRIGIEDQRIGRSDASSVGVCIAIGPHRVGFFESELPHGS